MTTNIKIKPTKKITRTVTVKGIEKSRQIAGEIYPILVDRETGEILDGNKRYKVDPEWKIEYVDVTSIEQKLAIKYHTIWWRQQRDYPTVLEEIAEETGWRGLKPFADFFGVTQETISKHLPQKYKTQIHKSHKKDSDVLKVEKDLKTLEETKKEVEKSIDVVADKNPELKKQLKETKEALSAEIKQKKEKIKKDKIKEKKKEKIKTPEQLQEESRILRLDQIDKLLEEMNWNTSVWRGHYERPEGYGDKSFHGNCSPVILMALLRRYSHPTHRVLDPTAGSGTFGDVALTIGYKKKNVYMSDIKSVRDDIEEYDAINLPHEDDFFDFTFAHIPYWDMVQYTVDNPKDASHMGFDGFLEWCNKLMLEMKRILKYKGYFCLMVGNRRKAGVVDLEAKISEIGIKHFKLWDKIIKEIRPWSPEKRGERMQLAMGRAKSQNRTMVNHDVILVFRREK